MYVPASDISILRIVRVVLLDDDDDEDDNDLLGTEGQSE